jgi:hypothetical protein
MNNLSRILTIKVIILLIGISIISSANEINILEELIENPKVEKFNEQKEIISFIRGISIAVHKTGFIKNEPINICPWKSGIKISGIKIPTLDSFMIFFSEITISWITASHFFGIVRQIGPHFMVSGIAIGNIDWDGDK